MSEDDGLELIESQEVLEMEIDSLRAALDALRAENERLRGVLARLRNSDSGGAIASDEVMRS